jgi:hypothetical protein
MRFRFVSNRTDSLPILPCEAGEVDAPRSGADGGGPLRLAPLGTSPASQGRMTQAHFS